MDEVVVVVVAVVGSSSNSKSSSGSIQLITILFTKTIGGNVVHICRAAQRISLRIVRGHGRSDVCNILRQSAKRSTQFGDEGE